MKLETMQICDTYTEEMHKKFEAQKWIFDNYSFSPQEIFAYFCNKLHLYFFMEQLKLSINITDIFKVSVNNFDASKWTFLQN